MSSQTFKQRGGGPPKSDRNANEENHHQQHQQQQEAAEKLQQELLPLPQLGAKPKSQRENKSQRILQTKTENQNQNQRQKAQSLQGYGNYMELEFIQAEVASSATFDDLPVSYATTSVAPVAPPPYREPPPPTPPPLSQIPSRESRLLHSAPNTPIRGKVVLSKKERKELSKQLGLEDLQGLPLGGSTSAQSSPYKGRVSELKNCIARGLFATLHRGTPKERELHINQEISPPPPAPESGNNNEDAADYSEKLKNLPVRQRKVATRHMDNYCLFDPVDFINDKAMRYPSATTSTSTSTSHGLRDPLFSSRQHLVSEDEDEMVPEVIYDNEELELEETIIIETSALPEAETEGCAEPKDVRIHFDHHNYFVIEPGVCTMDIGIPNPYTNEQLVNANLEQQNLEKLFQELENPASMSNSQESKDTETTSTALVESSTSTNSGSSMGSTSIQNQAQHSMKKKLTFLNLSPFRGGKKSGDKSTFEQQQRAISELVSTDHMLHLQQLLQEQRRDQRSHTVPVPTESNYVLFNPGPVPSRHVQYKIRRSRPLSTHSDADSGFLSPCSPDEMRGNPAILVLQQCDSVQGYIEIYTDWANYYLERAKSKRKVTDLSADCRDGLLLAEVIEAVTSFKVPDLVKKPKSQQQMYDNVNSCLHVLRGQSVGGLDNITTNDICAGRLKAVLALFFALSRFKQQAKQTKSIGVGCGSSGGGSGTASNTALSGGSVLGIGLGGSLRAPGTAGTLLHDKNQQEQQQQQQKQQQQQQTPQQLAQSLENGNEMVNRQIAPAYKVNGGTAIPLPATVMVQRRCPPDKVRPLPPTPNHTPSIPGLGKSGSDFNTSRPNSPPTSNHTIQSLKSGNNNSLRPPSIKSNHQSGIPSPSSPQTTAAAAAPQKHSMLDKLKLFNKEKQQNAVNAAAAAAANKSQIQQQQSKRTSSSSGFSSARSERSDSSLSLNDGHNSSQLKPPSISVSSQKPQQKHNTKQSKLLAAQQKKEQTKSKLDKKEKSPARSLHKEESGNESRSSTMGRAGKSSLARGGLGLGLTVEKNTLKTSSKSSLHSKSESKSSLKGVGAQQQQQQMLHSPSGTSLPKPIAAIKGTSKLPALAGGELLKRETSDISAANQATQTTQNISTISVQESQQQPLPLSTTTPHILKGPAPPPYYANSSPPSHISQGHPGMGGYLSEPSTPQHQQGIYASSSGSRLPPPKTALSAPRKLEYNAGPHILSSPPHRGAGLQRPMPNSAPNTPTASPSKFHTVPSKIVGTIYESKEEQQQQQPQQTGGCSAGASVLPMRPLLRGYNSHVTLPTRGARGGHHHPHPPQSYLDFCESDLGQGYCSDGDALRIGSSPATSRYQDIDNGYLSEGSSGLNGSIGGSTGGAVSHGKHFLRMMRARTPLPTTIEERIRNSRGSLDSIGTAANGSSAASQASSSGGSTTHSSSNSNSAGTTANHNNNHINNNNGGKMDGSPHHRPGSRNGRDNWSKMPEPLNGQKGDKSSEKSSPSRRSMGGGSGGSSKQGSPSSSSRTKGVPPSFGYVKRANGSMSSTAEQQNIVMMMAAGGGGGPQQVNGLPCGRTAHVSAVPRTANGRKIAPGTQTLPNDMNKLPPNTQCRSFSLTGPTAAQLSQSIRERLATGSHSLPKPGSDMHVFQHRMSNRPGTRHDGSLSDTQTYAEVKPEYSSYAMWLKHSNTAGSRLSDGDAIEQLQIGSPAMTRHGHKMIHNRSGGGPPGGQMPMQGNESPYVQSPRMNRSNSISYLQERTYPRSTKSEKMYPSMLSRAGDVEIEPYYCLPVGTNGVLSAQMAAAVAAQAQAQAQATQGNSGNNVVGGSVAWSQPTSPTPLNRGPFAASVAAAAAAAAAAGVLSPTHGTTAGATGMVGGMGMGPGLGSGLTGGHRLTYPKKNDEVHGSAASLLSGGSSLYGSAEERQAHEIRRLKRELQDARDQVLSLSSQLSTNAHVVTAFEQSLTNMTNRLQQLTATSERKDGELTDMRQTIELLRKQSIQAGLTTAHMQSMGQNQNHQLQSQPGDQKPPPGPGGSRSASNVNGNGTGNGNGNGIPIGLGMVRQHSTDSMCSLNSISSGCSAAQDKNKANKKKGWLRSSFTKAFSRNAKISKTSRHVGHHHHHNHHGQEHSSGKTPLPNGHGEPLGLAALATQPAPPLPNSKQGSPAKTLTLIDNAKPIDAIDQEDQQVVEDLKKQLREKDLVLTDIRLEALSSASQLESLKDMMNKMRSEMMSLKQNNERLQKLVTTRSLAGSEVSLGQAISPNGSVAGSSEVSRRYSLADGSARPPMELPPRLSEELEEECMPPAPAPEPPPPPAPNTAAVAPLSPSTHIDLTPPPPALETAPLASPVHMPSAVEDLPDVCDGKKIAIACYLGQPESFAKYCEELQELDGFYANGSIIASHEADPQAQGERKVSFAAASSNEFIVACTYISGKTTWQNLDYIVRKTFKDYVARIDPGTNLGLNTDSITSYHLGEAKRGPEMGFPELLPCGYIVGSVRTLYICLQGVGSLAFDSLIPRSIVHRYISLLTEHRRLILCGPSGTGKSYLARRLAEFLVARAGRGNPSEAIATFNVDHKSSKDLRQYLGHIAEQAAIANGASELPSVIILDNLHHASALGDVFSCLLSAGPANKLPCIIGTMSQATCNTTNLQLHHNFRWVLTANHMEPVKGFLGRFLRRRLFQLELQTQHAQPELASVLAWLPSVWQHINRFLEVHSSSDVTIGPRLFLSCPLDLKDSQVWFTDIWNYHLSPYLVEAVREGVQLYGRRGGAWNDPSVFIRNSYPWPYGPDSVPPLRQINAEDVGLEGVALTNGENQDPLLNMLMRLQEAANYSEAQDQESDCASLDSNVTPDSSAGAE
ncbi:protein sickie isoform X1 [Drosophila pseudoobscura]|uniref:Protein sickie isoform X1 n=3 Tax=Drosophila pseudoobscura pseudoobscura TaxID=46245 RepID=A0A6I8W0B9_DROPS|nr:protein sickie isoform X1 [Drosophila pseudoobscura]